MGLTNRSTGRGAVDEGLTLERRAPTDRVIALAGNPNVGKSTVFNALTGLNQHTGNWPGKTVSSAQGRCRHAGRDYLLVDLPGTYSLLAHSAEEEVARDFVCFGGADAAVVVCDATCLERNLNLALQIIEITPRTLLCVNLMDEAAKKGIVLDLDALSKELGVPVVGCAARSGRGLEELMDRLEALCDGPAPAMAHRVRYPAALEAAVEKLLPALKGRPLQGLSPRWVALRLLEREPTLLARLAERLGFDVNSDPALCAALNDADLLLDERRVDRARLHDLIVSSLVLDAEGVCLDVVSRRPDADAFDRKLDRLLTSRRTGIPIMLLLLGVVFWLTLAGANLPSSLLSGALFSLEGPMLAGLAALGAPVWLGDLLVTGVYRVLAWVVAVMLPPMAIFFPLFTLLEDLGYLPRVAFNLDHCFKKARACGKQALTMCMGFGCNAAGVVGCRIIDSPRERLIAIITNNFVPCNGRFPTLIAILTMFFAGATAGLGASLLSAVLLVAVVLLGVGMTFLVSRVLSGTILKGVPSSFTLELPPYRRPQFGKVIVRSVFDRTLFVLGRAVAVAAPAGLVIWLMANLKVGDMSLLTLCAGALDPFARTLGLDGVILMAFVLGFPANEIVLPIIIMAYLANGSLIEMDNLTALREILVQNGWTPLTALCTMLFSLMHWPCSTTCLTIGKETGSAKWTALAVLIPTGVGMAVCFAVATTARLLGLA